MFLRLAVNFKICTVTFTLVIELEFAVKAVFHLQICSDELKFFLFEQ